MKVAVVGGRDFTDKERLYRELDSALALWGDFTLISGGARGADRLAEAWAIERGIPTDIILPAYRGQGDWQAPLIRNRIIADRCDRMIAYWDGKSRGTRDAIGKARMRAKRVFIRSY
jgi:hypothetical protein